MSSDKKGGLTLMDISIILCSPMNFAKRLAALRKERGFTQQQMSDKCGMHISQYKRYEGGTNSPTIEVFGRIAVALSVSADMLLFGEGERGPDERLRLQFEAVSKLEGKEREAVETMLAGILHMHDAKRWQQTANVLDTEQTKPTASEPEEDKSQMKAAKKKRELPATRSKE